MTNWNVSISTMGLYKEHAAASFADACDWVKQYVDVKDVALIAHVWQGNVIVRTFVL